MRIFISGLTMRFRFSGSPVDTQIAGPAVYASIGCAALGGKPWIHAAMSSDVSRTELDELQRLGVRLDVLERRESPSLVLETPLRTSASGSFKLSDNPLVWMPSKEADVGPDDILFASNGDPEWLRRTIGKRRPGFLGLDMHVSWATIRPVAMDHCLRCADFISATEEEFSTISQETLADLRHRRAIIMRKRGAAGVSIASGWQECELPSPAVIEVVSDIGAGDLLFGAMATAAAREFGQPERHLSTFCQAYEQVKCFVATVLLSSGPSELLRRLSIVTRRHA